VVVGHSERREYHGETDELINAKAKVVLAAGMTPIICVGEGSRSARPASRSSTCWPRSTVLADLTAEQVGSLVIAYEPVWAIGTGEVATPADAQEVCGAIRGRVAELVGQEAADKVRIQYGGSVKSGNVVEIMAQPDVDGALVGGASLDPEEFAKIVLLLPALSHALSRSVASGSARSNGPLGSAPAPRGGDRVRCGLTVRWVRIVR
jgi:triosephosphate isomerase